MWDKFEEVRERELVEIFEEKERTGKAQFEGADTLITEIRETVVRYGDPSKTSKRAPKGSRPKRRRT